MLCQDSGESATANGLLELAEGVVAGRRGIPMLADGMGWKESAVGSSRDSLGKGAAAKLKEESRKTSGSNIGGAYKIESQILMCLPKS